MRNIYDINFELATLLNNKVLFTSDKVDKTLLPKNMFCYYIRHSDDDWDEPATLEKFVRVNLYGTIISKNEIVINDYIDINSTNFQLDCREITLDEYIKNEYN